MKILVLIISLASYSCAQKDISNQNTVQFIGKKYSELKKDYTNLKPDTSQVISKKVYAAYKLNAETNHILILVDTKSDQIVESLKFYSEPSAASSKTIYTSEYQPKCEGNLTKLKYNTDKKMLLLTKADQIIFEGHSELIQDRLADDKNKKCLNHWNH